MVERVRPLKSICIYEIKFLTQDMSEKLYIEEKILRIFQINLKEEENPSIYPLSTSPNPEWWYFIFLFT